MCSYLEEGGLHLRPDTYVILVDARGPSMGTSASKGVPSTSVLFHDALRNTVRLLLVRVKADATAAVYRRCLYCGAGGTPAVRLVGVWADGEGEPGMETLFPSECVGWSLFSS